MVSKIPRVYSFTNLTEAYVSLFDVVLSSPLRSDPRGLSTRYVPLTILELSDLASPFIGCRTRRLNPIFQAAELFTFWAVDSRLEVIKFYNSQFEHYASPEGALDNHYGVKLHSTQGIDQFRVALNILKADSDSRQAVLSLVNPSSTLGRISIPCNCLLQFQISQGVLDLYVYVRSQDLIFGFPYDISHWLLYQKLAASILNVPVGHYFHIMSNLHLYESQIDWAKSIADDPCCSEYSYCPQLPFSSHQAFQSQVAIMASLEAQIRIYEKVDFSILDSSYLVVMLQLMYLRALRNQKDFHQIKEVVEALPFFFQEQYNDFFNKKV